MSRPDTPHNSVQEHAATCRHTKPPLFILGCPRSGTTMLAQLLADTEWGAPFETQFIVKYYDQIHNKSYDLRRSADFRTIVSRIAKERPVLQSKADLDPGLLHNELNEITPAALFDLIARKMRRARAHESWGDKTPFYALRPDVLIDLYPDSKVLLIVRDGRDVALSLMKKNWGPSNIYSCAHLWLNYHRSTAKLQHYDNKGHLLTLRYEDLLADPAQMSSKVFEFLGAEPGNAAHQQWLRQVKSSNHNKWSDSLSLKDIALFEMIAGKELTELGYKTSQARDARVRSLDAFYYNAHNVAKHVKNLLYMNTVEHLQIRLFGKEPFAD